MPDPNLMMVRAPLSLEELGRVVGWNTRMLVNLIPIMCWDYFFERDDFRQALDSNHWTTAVTAGGAPTAFAFNAQRGGVIRGATGTTNDGVTAIHHAQTFLDAADNPFMIIRFKLPAAVSGFSFEIGLSDPKTDEALPGVTDVDTPATGNGVTDIVCVHMDTAQTLTTPALVTDGSTDAAAKTNITVGGPNGSTAWTPTASKFVEMVIGVRANKGFCHIWEDRGYIGSFSVNSGPDTGVLMRPYALFRTRDTTSKTIDIDYIAYGCERNAT